MKPVFLLVPYWMGDLSPHHLALARHTWRLVVADIPPEEPPPARIGAVGRVLAEHVAAVRAAGQLPVVLAGDCTASIGVAAGLQQHSPDFTLVWYDAHGDFNTWETSPSGFIGGMPLAMLCGRGEQTILEQAGARPHPEQQVVLTDARDLDPLEKEAVTRSGLTHLPAVAGLQQVDLADRPIYVHFDPDVLNLADLAAVNYPAQGGPTLAEVEASLAHLAGTGRIAALSVTLWNPELDDESGRAEQVVMGLVERLVDRLAD